MPEQKKSGPKLDWSKWNLRKFDWVTIGSILSYLNILALIPFFFMRKNKFAQFHAKQGIALLIVWVILGFSFYLLFLPWIVALFIIVCMIIGIINVVTGHERTLPLIGKLAE